jgi:signal transduction histidine kinase
MMMTSADELDRLDALRRYKVMDTAPEASFDRIADIAARLFGTPVALVSLVDETRQWFKARHGFELTEIPRALSLCEHAIRNPGEVLVVSDTMRDPRFAENPFVTGGPHIRFYAGAPLLTPDGFALGTVCVVDDKPHVGFGDQHRDDLRHLAAIAMSELELRAGKAAAEIANRSKNRLMAAVGHDLRQPLTVIAGNLELLEAHVDARGRRMVARAVAATLRMETAFRWLTEAARLEYGRIEPRLQPFDLGALLEEIRDQHTDDARRKDLLLKVRPCHQVVMTDPGLLGSIMHNLVDNAVKYTDNGRIVVACRRQGERAVVQVWDTGVGIAPEMLAEIFTDYRQLAPESGGVGLGLSIVKRAADLLGHRLGVRSTPGRGSCFEIAIPVGERGLDGLERLAVAPLIVKISSQK